LLRRNPALDIVRIQDVGLTHATDPEVLEWAAHENRVLLTHEQNTVTKFAYQRVLEGRRMPGVIEVNSSVPMSIAIENILLLTLLSKDRELEGQIVYLPLR